MLWCQHIPSNPPSRLSRLLLPDLRQFGFGIGFTLAYIISPRLCHRFVGYVEEEACSTYTKIIKAIENAPEGSELASWRTEPPPPIAVAYWKLGKEGTILDMVKAVRADEAEHRYEYRCSLENVCISARFVAHTVALGYPHSEM